MRSELENIVQHLQLAAELNHKINEQSLSNKLRDLQTWQCQRLVASHDALLTNRKYRPAMTFFIDELYGPKDFAQRDDDIARIAPKMSKILPAAALQSLEQALHLNALSLRLDYELVQKLKNEHYIDNINYANAYLACDNKEARAQQIDFIAALGNDLAEVTNIIGIGILLKMSRKPAQLAGFLSLHEFLENGFNAFKKIGKVEDFINPIVKNERDVMNQLFDGQNNLPDVRI